MEEKTFIVTVTKNDEMPKNSGGVVVCLFVFNIRHEKAKLY